MVNIIICSHCYKHGMNNATIIIDGDTDGVSPSVFHCTTTPMETSPIALVSKLKLF